jgi:hypothetical protein
MNGTQYIEKNEKNYRMAQRVSIIKSLAAENNVSTDRVHVHIGNDWAWLDRSNRTDAQRKTGVKVGQTNSTTHGKSIETVFAWVE